MKDILPKACEKCSRIPYGIFQLLSFMTICAIVTLIIVNFHMRQIWKSDWEKYRCYLPVIPTASFINPGVSLVDNFKFCVKKKTDPMIKAYTKHRLETAASNAARQIEQNNMEAKKADEEVKETVDETESRFSELYKFYDKMVNLMNYTSHKVQNFFFKIGAVIWTIYYLLISSINSIMIQIAVFQKTLAIVNAISLVFGYMLSVYIPPLGLLLLSIIAMTNAAEASAQNRAYCCFTPDSIIDKGDKSKCPIEDIRLGDELLGGGVVTGTIEVFNPGTSVVNIGKNTNVTYDHLFLNVFGKWQYAGETNGTQNKTNVLKCLVTTNNIIPSSGTLYRDYEEVADNKTQCKMSSMILHSLGNFHGNIKPDYELGERNNCLPSETRIRMNNGTFKRIDSINIGDKYFGGIVTGIYRCNAREIEWFEVKGVCISPRIICSIEKTGWTKAYNVGLPYSKSIPKTEIGYHLITSSGYFEIENHILVRDFVETTDDLIQEFISNIVLSRLNGQDNQELKFM